MEQGRQRIENDDSWMGGKSEPNSGCVYVGEGSAQRGSEGSRPRTGQEQSWLRTWLQLGAQGFAAAQGRGLIRSNTVFTQGQGLQHWEQSKNFEMDRLGLKFDWATGTSNDLSKLPNLREPVSPNAKWEEWL